jgi:hypothetical protein
VAPTKTYRRGCEVHEIDCRLAAQHPIDVRGDCSDRPRLGFGCEGRDMRSEDNILHLLKRALFQGRLELAHVQRRTCQMIRFKRSLQRLFIDYSSSRGL